MFDYHYLVDSWTPVTLFNNILRRGERLLMMEIPALYIFFFFMYCSPNMAIQYCCIFGLAVQLERERERERESR